MRKKQLSPFQVASILHKLGRGLSISAIATEFNVHKTTIYRRLKAFDEEKRIGRRKSQRVTKIGLADKQKLKTYLENEPFASLRDIQSNLNLPVCFATIRKYGAKMGLRHKVSPRKFLIKALDAEARLEIALRRSSWRMDKWTKLIFCDEFGVDNSGAQRRHVWRPKGFRFDQQYIYKAPNKTLKLNFFAWITYDGPGMLVEYRKMNSNLYCEIVTSMIQILKDQYGENFRVIHDNAAFSKSSFTRHYLSSNNLQQYFMQIPAYSPDMNPIENCFGLLKNSLREKTFLQGQTRSRASFIEIVNQHWSSLSIDTIKNLYHSLPSRMRAIIGANGNLSKY